MTDLRITRTFSAPPELVFDFLTRRRHLLDWWGPEGTSLPDENLDFTRPGPWHSVMMNADGRRFKVSGEVVEVTPPRAVAFTWGWHDEHDDRGPESLVRIELHPVDSGTEFLLTHADLPSDDSSANHERGWTSSLAKLERLLA